MDICYLFTVSWFGACSTCGHIVEDCEGLNFYTATKFAVSALTEGLRVELRGIKSNIKITVRKPYTHMSIIQIQMCAGNITRWSYNGI